jgi:RNA polymerase sigma-70 factor (ECF subfamily)
MNTTQPSLLDQLRQPANPAAWERFVELYAPLLHGWAQRLGLQSADAENLVQDVFVTLLQELPRFLYQPGKRFRGWLWTVTVNKFRQQGRLLLPIPVGTGEPDEGKGPNEIEAIEEAEYQRYLVSRVMRLMQSDFEPTTWKACWEQVVNGRAPAEVAAELGITINAAHLAKARVLRRLRQELAGLLD